MGPGLEGRWQQQPPGTLWVVPAFVRSKPLAFRLRVCLPFPPGRSVSRRRAAQRFPEKTDSPAVLPFSFTCKERKKKKQPNCCPWVPSDACSASQKNKYIKQSSDRQADRLQSPTVLLAWRSQEGLGAGQGSGEKVFLLPLSDQGRFQGRRGLKAAAHATSSSKLTICLCQQNSKRWKRSVQHPVNMATSHPRLTLSWSPRSPPSLPLDPHEGLHPHLGALELGPGLILTQPPGAPVSTRV